jgi:hypothetical protein
LRRLLLIGIGDLVGALGLLLERDCDVERKSMNVRHRLDLRLGRVRKRHIGGRVQLLLEPALDADRTKMLGARGVHTPRQSIEQNQVRRVVVGSLRGCAKDFNDDCRDHRKNDAPHQRPAATGCRDSCNDHRNCAPI